MSYGLDIANENGNSIFNSDDTPYTFTNEGAQFVYTWVGQWYEAYADFTGSPEALCAAEWPLVAGSPSAGWNSHGFYLRITSLGGDRYRATPMHANQRARLFNNNPMRLFVIDKVTQDPVSNTFGIEVFDSSQKRIFTASTKVAKISQYGTVTVSGNTVLGGNSNTQILFTNAYYLYRRLGSLIGPWYDDIHVYTSFCRSTGDQFRATRMRFTRGDGYSQARFEAGRITYLIVDKPD